MRAAFSREMENLAQINKQLVLLSGDIGNRMFDSFKNRFPDRFYNCGIAEANMSGIAAGLAMSGFRPVTYTIAAFNTLRCLEQIRIDICYQNLPVIIVGVGGGLSYASLNATHQSLEDIASLRAIPNITIICPGDAWEVTAAIRKAIALDTPVYLRMAKKNEPVIHNKLPNFIIGKGLVVKAGNDVCILNCGSLLPVAMEVASMFEKLNISVHVVSMHTVKPLDTDLLEDVFSRFQHVITLEEHGIYGGFGSAVGEWYIQREPTNARLTCIGSGDKFMYEAGDLPHARKFFGLTASQIYNKIYELIN